MTATRAALTPAAISAATSTAYTAPSRKSTNTIRNCSPVSLPNSLG